MIQIIGIQPIYTWLISNIQTGGRNQNAAASLTAESVYSYL